MSMTPTPNLPSATRAFDIAETTRAVTVAGDPDKLCVFDPTVSHSWLAMTDPIDLHDWR